MRSANIRSQTPNQHQCALQAAHSKHEVKYKVDHPKHVPESFSNELTLLEKLVQHLWIVWTVLALVGAFISLAHALSAVLNTLDHNLAVVLVYTLAAFLGVELALTAFALASELKAWKQTAGKAPKQRRPDEISARKWAVNQLRLGISSSVIYLIGIAKHRPSLLHGPLPQSRSSGEDSMDHLPADTRIDWNCPEPRRGLAGEWDKFIGSGAVPTENILFVLSALAGAVFAFVLLSGFDRGPIKLIVAMLMAGDLFGGAAANASSVTKRWYYRAGQTSLHQLGFILLHLGYVALVAWVFRESGHLLYFLVIGGALLISALVVLVPLWLRRSVAVLMVLGAILLNLYVVQPAAGLEWFVPVLWLKLILGHAVREEPYRPAAT